MHLYFCMEAVFGLPKEEEVTLRKVVPFHPRAGPPGDSAESHQPSTLLAAKGTTASALEGALGDRSQYLLHLIRYPLLVADWEHKCRSSDSKPN